MDSYITKFQQKTSKQPNNLRSPLLPSEKNENNGRSTPVRQIASRYKSSSSPNKRYPSPNVPHTTPSPSLPKRAHSAERRRSIVPSSPSSSSSCSSSSSSSSSGPNTPLGDTLLGTRSNSRQHIMWPSMRSLSSAFQSECISIPVTKTEHFNSSPRARWQPTIGRNIPVAKTNIATKPKKAVPVPNRGSQSVANGRETPVQPVGCIGDFKKGKRGIKQIEDAYKLRMVYNKLLQWRFVNSSATKDLIVRKENSEGMLYAAWNAISGLIDSVVRKRLDLQELLKEEKIYFHLNNQILYLEEWADLEKEHSTALSGSIGALKASTLRIPVMPGAKADLHGVKNAVSSAVDIMQAMGSSVCSLIDKVEDKKSIVSELSSVVIQEKIMLEEYRELLSMVAQLQVQESSLRAEVMQLRK